MMAQRQSPQRQRIGPAIRRLRRGRKLTLDDLAEAAGISASHLSRLERSQTLPSFPVLAKLADALGMNVNEFVRLEEDVARLDTELAEHLELLALGHEERAELMSLSIEARRALVDRLGRLACPTVTPLAAQDAVARAAPGGLERLTRTIREVGLSGIGFTRSLALMDALPGPRSLLIGGPSLLLLMPGTPDASPLRAYRAVFGAEPMDPAVLGWWRGDRALCHANGNGAFNRQAARLNGPAWERPERPVRVLLSEPALAAPGASNPVPAGTVAAMLRSLREAVESGRQVQVAVTDDDLGAVNVGLAGECAAIVEQLPLGGREAFPKRVGLWLDAPHAVRALREVVRRRWDDLPARARDRAAVMTRLERAIQDLEQAARSEHAEPAER